MDTGSHNEAVAVKDVDGLRVKIESLMEEKKRRGWKVGRDVCLLGKP
jgi:hypothetical protein